MADNVIVRVPEQQFIRGEDGYSPEVTIEDIAHGHSVIITDRDHPEGQSFNVLDGDSAYEQAVAGGYEGTEAQFNAELGSFGELSEQAASSATTATTRAEQAKLAYHRAEDAQVAAEAAAAQALTRMNSADASAQAAATTATTFTEQTVPAAANTINEAKADALTAVGNAQTTAVGAVQQESTTQQAAIQQKGEDVLESIPADYTELSEDVDDLKSALSVVSVNSTDWGLMYGNVYPVLIEPMGYGDTVTFLWSANSQRAFLLFKKDGTASYDIAVPENFKIDIPNNSNLWVNLTDKTLVVDASWHYANDYVFMGRNYFGRLMGGIYTDALRGVLLEKKQMDIRFNEMFSRDVTLSIGNYPTFEVNNNVITVTFSGNVFVTKKLSNSTLYNYSNLGGSYSVPSSSYCVVNLTSGTIQVLTSSELFTSQDEFAVLFFNHYGYPKFGWEHYYLYQKHNLLITDLRFNEMFSRKAVLSLGNYPLFKQNGTNLTVTFSGNVFVTKKLSNSTLYNYSNLGGSYDVPINSFCVIDLVAGRVRVFNASEMMTAVGEYVVLFFNHYGYPKFGWEQYWDRQKINESQYDINTRYAYDGEQIKIKNTFSYEKVTSGTKGYSQGGACYGDYLFQFHSQDQVQDGDFHGCTVINLKTKEVVQFIDLGYDTTIHNNNASFGNVKYDNSDTFPLLYVSQEDSRKCLVYRVIITDGVYSLSLVQTILFPMTTDWVGTYPNACIGDDGYLYVLGYMGNNNYDLLKFTLPALSNATVQLTLADAIASCNITIDTNAQGFMVQNNKFYVTAGAASYSIMQVNSTADGRLLSKVVFNEVGLPYEPEAIYLHRGILCITFVIDNFTVYRFDF